MSDNTRNILITGAAGGLGGALAVDCARRGAQVLLVDKDLRGLEATCDRVEAEQGFAPSYCQLDLATAGPDAMNELIGSFTDSYGEMDGLAHCAAHFDGLRPLEQVPGDTWLTHIQVNLNAAWLLTVSCLPSLRLAGGTIVFTLEDEARSRGAFWGPYGVSKAALRSMAQVFAEELEDSGCRVFGIDPGPMRSGIRANAYMAEDPASQPLPDMAAGHFAALLMGQGGGMPVIHSLPEK